MFCVSGAYMLLLYVAEGSANPTITALDPADNDGAVSPTNSKLTMTFNENIERGVGAITVTRWSDGSTQVIALSSVTITGHIVTFNVDPAGSGQSYYVTMPAGTFISASKFSHLGLLTEHSWNFTTTGNE